MGLGPAKLLVRLVQSLGLGPAVPHLDSFRLFVAGCQDLGWMLRDSLNNGNDKSIGSGVFKSARAATTNGSALALQRVGNDNPLGL